MSLKLFDYYQGSLLELFYAGYLYAQTSCHPDLWLAGKAVSFWVKYSGADCAPFSAYLRFAKRKIVIANISGPDSTSVRKGRMPLILDAAFSVASIVEVESVVNRHLALYLEANDFILANPGDISPTYYKVRDNVVL